MAETRTPVTLIVMVGGSEASEVEHMVARACQAAAADTIERSLASGEFQHWIVATSSADYATGLGKEFAGVEISLDESEFHFGRRLRDLIDSRRIAAPFYCGGGAGVLLDSSALARMAQRVACGSDLVLSNNFYSSDLCAFNPGCSIQRIELPDTDNDLAWRLATRAGMTAVTLERGAAALMDIDTPTDLLMLLAHPGVGPRLRSLLDELHLDRQALDRVLGVLRTPGARVALAGRVGASACRYLEQRTGCRVVAFAEERGLRASGRQGRREARTLLAFLAGKLGWREVMDRMAEVADAWLFDTRVVLAHNRLWPSAADRFWSDLGRPDRIEDGDLRALTEAAIGARIPVLLGGHSLVSGGLYALVDGVVSADGNPMAAQGWGRPGVADGTAATTSLQ